MNTHWTVACTCGYLSLVADKETAVQLGASHGNKDHQVLVINDLVEYAFGNHRVLTRMQRQAVIALHHRGFSADEIRRMIKVDLYWRLPIEAAIESAAVAGENATGS
jgi:hypothetical protein